VILASVNYSTILVWLSGDDGNLTYPWFYHTDGGPSYIDTGDLDGDGDLDMVSANWSAQVVSVYLGNETGVFVPSAGYKSGDGAMTVLCRDFDGDGDVDLVLANRLSNDIAVLLNETND